MIKLLKKTFTSLITIPAFAESAAKKTSRVINGSYKISFGTIAEDIKINGETVLGQDTLVKNIMIINGKLKASGVTFESDLFANGTSTISHCWLKNNSHFSGSLTANNCQFHENLNLLAHPSSFSNCEFEHITIKKLPYFKHAQVIRLQKGCIVNGDVTFEGGNGEVYLDKSSEIKGAIHGGRKIAS